MARAIINGELTQEHIDYLYYLTSTVDRENDLYICDPVHLIKPVFDVEFTYVGLQWRGDWYQYSLSAGKPLFVFTVYDNQNDYDHFIETNYTNVLNTHKESLKTTESAPNVDSIIHYYENISLKQIRCYQLPCKSGNITVVEQYYDDSTIPYSVKFYGTHNGTYFSGGCEDSFLNTNGDRYQQILQSMELTTVTYEAQP